MRRLLDGMNKTMNAVQPPRMTALRQLHDAETSGPFSILIGTILSARTRDENTAKVVKKLFAVYKNAKELSGAYVLTVHDERIVYLEPKFFWYFFHQSKFGLFGSFCADKSKPVGYAVHVYVHW